MSFFKKIFNIYYEGIKNSGKTGKTLLVIIFIKFFIMFFVLKLFFFKNYLSERCRSEQEKANYVIDNIIK